MAILFPRGEWEWGPHRRLVDSRVPGLGDRRLSQNTTREVDGRRKWSGLLGWRASPSPPPRAPSSIRSQHRPHTAAAAPLEIKTSSQRSQGDQPARPQATETRKNSLPSQHAAPVAGGRGIVRPLIVNALRAWRYALRTGSAHGAWF
jgi:hypothetical protein